MSDAEFVANLQRKYDLLEDDVMGLYLGISLTLQGREIMIREPESLKIREIWNMLKPIFAKYEEDLKEGNS